MKKIRWQYIEIDEIKSTKTTINESKFNLYQKRIKEFEDMTFFEYFKKVYKYNNTYKIRKKECILNIHSKMKKDDN
jgi:hypothetical protein